MERATQSDDRHQQRRRERIHKEHVGMLRFERRQLILHSVDRAAVAEHVVSELMTAGEDTSRERTLRGDENPRGIPSLVHALHVDVGETDRRAQALGEVKDADWIYGVEVRLGPCL